jgi:hypothetical protein
VFISHHQNAGQSCNLKVANRSFENLRMTATGESCVDKGIGRKLNSGNVDTIQYRILCRLSSLQMYRLKYMNYSIACCFVQVYHTMYRMDDLLKIILIYV